MFLDIRFKIHIHKSAYKWIFYQVFNILKKISSNKLLVLYRLEPQCATPMINSGFLAGVLNSWHFFLTIFD